MPCLFLSAAIRDLRSRFQFVHVVLSICGCRDVDRSAIGRAGWGWNPEVDPRRLAVAVAFQ
eukprot:2651438-Pyramimonas_sp.AAC.1